ncbi:hypothetical protein E2C01_039575 [Portunus trituberculatus]|uniref:Uncharacterized protein n=1 Tax=Portunus trituberculatus TaxID=210409 RepID=A0A5B7FL47_PORTR|nr:hypothetical protein [Portunus trituberculatus]
MTANTLSSHNTCVGVIKAPQMLSKLVPEHERDWDTIDALETRNTNLISEVLPFNQIYDKNFGDLNEESYIQAAHLGEEVSTAAEPSGGNQHKTVVLEWSLAFSQEMSPMVPAWSMKAPPSLLVPGSTPCHLQVMLDVISSASSASLAIVLLNLKDRVPPSLPSAHRPPSFTRNLVSSVSAPYCRFISRFLALFPPTLLSPALHRSLIKKKKDFLRASQSTPAPRPHAAVAGEIFKPKINV